ncbi:MAG: hypothetical protein JNK87_08780 [Bryobacterales bacterium]|nr:hypothetical protein [Bryobacterales bacterium]
MAVSMMARHAALRIMMVGFGLVVLLVLSAAHIGYQGSRSIQSLAQQLVREHLLTNEKGSELEASIERQSEELLNELEGVLATCFVLAFGCATLTIVFITRTLRRLEWQTEELNRVSWNMLEDQERVARRFSHEMHDELGQALTGLKGMAKRLPAAEFEVRRKEFVEILDEVLTGVRELSQLLRPVILDDFGLDAGLRWLIERFAQRTQIDVEYNSNYAGRASDAIETHLFRITQEALTNIARHSGATRARVKLEATRTTIRLRIEDNGRGLGGHDLNQPSLGMVGMRARARHLDGILVVDTGELGGVRILVEAPLKEAEDSAEQKDTSVAGG